MVVGYKLKYKKYSIDHKNQSEKCNENGNYKILFTKRINNNRIKDRHILLKGRSIGINMQQSKHCYKKGCGGP